MKRLITAGALSALSFLALPSEGASAAPAEAQQHFQRAEAALKRGALSEAIGAYEAFADTGVKHPDMSFNRGMAYLKRFRSDHGKPGDLGRAAAAFEEVLLVAPADPQATLALRLIRAEVARGRARRGAKARVSARGGAFEQVASVASENIWAWLALLTSLLTSIGLGIWRFGRANWAFSGGLAAAIFGILMGIFGGLGYQRQWARRHTGTGVIVRPEARMVTVDGAPKNIPAVPEAARVQLRGRQGRLYLVHWGEFEGYTDLGNLRVIRRPEVEWK